MDLDREGTPQVLTEVENPRGADWNSDGVILLAPARQVVGLQTIPASVSNGQMNPVLLPDEDILIMHPHFLPEGRRFLFFEQDAASSSYRVSAGSLDSSEVTGIGEFASRVEYANGYLFFGQQGTLFAQRFDPDLLELSGEPIHVADGLGLSFGELSTSAFSVSDDVLVYSGGGSLPESHLLAYDRAGRSIGSIGTPAVTFGFVVSPDGSTAALERWGPGYELGEYLPDESGDNAR